MPGSISVLDRELIQASGARELTELLRLVPGMIVVTDDIKVQVNYHGGHAAQARRMQVLIDGRSVYRPGLAEVDWKDLPVSLEDIERIEVFRGPNTVSYGANALTGVVNIITRRPEESLVPASHIPMASEASGMAMPATVLPGTGVRCGRACHRGKTPDSTTAATAAISTTTLTCNAST